MQVTGMLYGSRLLQFVGFPTLRTRCRNWTHRRFHDFGMTTLELNPTIFGLIYFAGLLVIVMPWPEAVN